MQIIVDAMVERVLVHVADVRDDELEQQLAELLVGAAEEQEAEFEQRHRLAKAAVAHEDKRPHHHFAELAVQGQIVLGKQRAYLRRKVFQRFFVAHRNVGEERHDLAEVA